MNDNHNLGDLQSCLQLPQKFTITPSFGGNCKHEFHWFVEAARENKSTILGFLCGDWCLIIVHKSKMTSFCGFSITFSTVWIFSISTVVVNICTGTVALNCSVGCNQRCIGGGSAVERRSLTFFQNRYSLQLYHVLYGKIVCSHYAFPLLLYFTNTSLAATLWI